MSKLDEILYDSRDRIAFEAVASNIDKEKNIK